MTTVGYGDISPKTEGGRVIAIVVMLVGIGFVALLTAARQRFIARVESGGETDSAVVAELRALSVCVEELQESVRRRED